MYQRGLERWLADLLQPVFDNLISDKAVPRFVQRLRILEFTLDHEAPYFDNIRRRSSRKDSDLNGVVDVRYTGGARMLLQLEVGQGRWRLKVRPLCPDTLVTLPLDRLDAGPAGLLSICHTYTQTYIHAYIHAYVLYMHTVKTASALVTSSVVMQIPVLVSDLDLECQLWLKIRLAPMTPYFGTVSLAFVGPPTIKVQLLPYNRVRLMQVPIVQVHLPLPLSLKLLHVIMHMCSI